MAGQGVISPVLPLFADAFGVSTTMIGATITAFGLARLFTNIPAGALADRNGRRQLLIGGPLITAVGMFASGLAPSIWPLLGARFIAGFGSALYMTGAQIYLLDIAGPAQRGRFIATNQAALLVGLGFGPALGGLLAGRFGLEAPFFAVATSAVVTAIYGYLRLPETLPRRRDPKVVTDTDQASSPATTCSQAPSFNRWSALASREFLAIGFVTVGVFSIRAGVRQTLVPLKLNQTFGLEVDELGILFTALGVLGLVLIWPAGWAADRFSRRLVIVPTALAIAAGMALVSVATTLTIFIVGLAISAVGSSITGPAPAAFVADLVEPEQRGAAMGLYRTFGDLGVVLSPIVSGWLADATSLSVAIGANAAFMGVAAFVFWGVSSGSSTPPVSTTVRFNS